MDQGGFDPLVYPTVQQSDTHRPIFFLLLITKYYKLSNYDTYQIIPWNNSPEFAKKNNYDNN